MYPITSDRERKRTRATYADLEIEGHRHKQAPQSSTTVGTQIYFNLICKFNNMYAIKRATKEAAIHEDIKHVLDDVWGLPPEETSCEILAKESCLGVDYVLVISQEELHDISCKTEGNDAVHLALVDAGKIRILIH